LPGDEISPALLQFRAEELLTDEILGRNSSHKGAFHHGQKAFCIGINDYPGEGSDLSGCVNPVSL